MTETENRKSDIEILSEIYSKKQKEVCAIDDESRQYVQNAHNKAYIEAQEIFKERLSVAYAARDEVAKEFKLAKEEAAKQRSLADKIFPPVGSMVIQWAYNEELKKFEIHAQGIIEIWENGASKPKQFKRGGAVPSVGSKYIRKLNIKGKPSLVIFKIDELRYRKDRKEYDCLWTLKHVIRTRVWRAVGVDLNATQSP